MKRSIYWNISVIFSFILLCGLISNLSINVYSSGIYNRITISQTQDSFLSDEEADKLPDYTDIVISSNEDFYEDRAIKSVRSPVVNICNMLKEDITIHEFTES